jgi:hypothetical protein
VYAYDAIKGLLLIEEVGSSSPSSSSSSSPPSSPSFHLNIIIIYKERS